MFPVIADAVNVDYAEKLREVGCPRVIDYLQIDLEPSNRSPLTALEILDRTVMSDHTFSTVTFEHDVYLGDQHNVRYASRKIFQKRGYMRLFEDVVCNKQQWPFEDWYVHPSVMSQEIFDRIRFDGAWQPRIMPEVCVNLVKQYVSAF